MRIMEMISGTTVNGAMNHCLLLTRELVRRGHEVTLVCRPTAWIAKQVASEPVEVIASDLHRWPPDELRRVSAIIRERGIDLVHTHMSRAHFFGVLLRWFCHVPTVATAHSRLIQLHWMFNDLVIAVSEATRHYHQTRNLVWPSRLVTIHNFIDDRRIAAVPSDSRARMRASLGFDDASLVVGAIGNVIPRKGHLYLVRALPEILEAVPQTRLLVVGGKQDARYVEQVEATAAELGVADRILWTGHREDVPELMTAMDVCVLASLEESLPLVLLEAMAAGLPVVSTAVGGVAECVLDGQTGRLVPPANSHALAKALLELLADPARRQQFGEAGSRRARESFSPESQATAIERAFAQVVERRAA